MAVTSELIEKWWKWFLAGDSPPTDVFFAESKRMMRDDKEILDASYTLNSGDIPVLINVDKWISLGFEFTPDDLLIKTAKERIDQLTKMSINIDGVPVQPERQTQSKIFRIQLKQDMLLPELGPEKIPKGKYKAASDGYWIYLQNMKPGKHHIETFASCRLGTLSLGVHHNFNVKE